jgi:hypothetical protein
MTKPAYITHEVHEKDVTVDWFFGTGRRGTKLVQLGLLLIGWFFVVLPVVITASSLLNRDDDEGGWWNYQEGFDMWDRTMRYLGILTVFFILGFLALHLIDRATVRKRNQRKTYDEQRLARRMDLADAWYADKFGPEAFRRQQRNVHIEHYSDVETYELRGLYRANGVG